MVVGVSPYGGILSEFAKAQNCRIDMERDSNYPLESDTIKVFAVWNSSRVLIGYVPADISKRVADIYPGRRIAAVPTAVFLPNADYPSAALRFNLYVEKPER